MHMKQISRILLHRFLFCAATRFSGTKKYCLLQARFTQTHPVSMAQTVGPPMAMFPAGGHGVNQQLFYGQQTSTLLTHYTRAELTFP